MRNYVFLVQATFVCLFCFAILTAFNVAIDYHRIFETPDWAGLNVIREEHDRMDRTVKAHFADLLDPTVLILGTSRAEFGLDPQDPRFKGERVFNFGVPSATIFEMRRVADYALLKYRSLHEMDIGLDFFAFDIAKEKFRASFSKCRFDALASYWKRVVCGIVEHPGWVFSMDALKKSFSAVGFSGRRDARLVENHDIDGSIELSSFDNDVRGKSQRPAFFIQEGEFLRTYWRPDGPQPLSFEDRDGAKSLVEFGEMLRDFYRSGITVRFYISPMHARFSWLLKIVGLYTKWEDWKRQITRINETMAKEVDHAPYPIADFSGCNAVTTEEVPALNDTTTLMKNYVETSHARKDSVGHLILDVLREGVAPTKDEFGIDLHSGTINRHLLSIRDVCAGWAEAHPLDVQELESEYAEYRKWLESTQASARRTLW